MAHIQDRGREHERRWQARFRDPAGRERSRTFRRKLDAQRWLNEQTTDMTLGRYVDPSAGSVSFRDYAEQWRKARPLRPSTQSMYERTLRIHVYPTLGDRPLSSVKRSDIQGWIGELAQRRAPATVRGAYGRVATIFRAAVDDRLVVETPCRNITLPELPDDKVVPLTIAQVRQLVEAAPEDLRALVVLAAATGLRSGELLGLTVDHVDFLRRRVKVEQQLVYIVGQDPFLGPPKTKASRRTVPVPSFALEEVAAHLQRHPAGQDGLLFTSSSGEPIRRTTLNGRWVRLVERAGLPKGTGLHDLRHHYASVLIDGGESVKVVQARLGHASASETLDTYSHLFPDSEERTLAVVAAAWSDAPAESSRNEQAE